MENHAGINNVVSERFIFFLVDEGIEDLTITINRPSSVRQRNAI